KKLSLSIVVIAPMHGPGGISNQLDRANNSENIGQGFEAGLAIVLVAILLDRVCKQRGGGA
ncbi:MAG: choline ABC transporter permease subunit, partial [Geminicoccaceae bacterium]